MPKFIRNRLIAVCIFFAVVAGIYWLLRQDKKKEPFANTDISGVIYEEVPNDDGGIREEEPDDAADSTDDNGVKEETEAAAEEAARALETAAVSKLESQYIDRRIAMGKKREDEADEKRREAEKNPWLNWNRRRNKNRQPEETPEQRMKREEEEENNDPVMLELKYKREEALKVIRMREQYEGEQDAPYVVEPAPYYDDDDSDDAKSIEVKT